MMQNTSVQRQVDTAAEEGLFTVGPNGKVNYCNTQLEELVGLKSSDVVGRPYADLLGEIASLSSNETKTATELLTATEPLSAASSPEPITVSLQARDSMEGRLQVKFFPIHHLGDNQELEQVGWGGMIIDTTAEWTELAQWTEHLSALTQNLRAHMASIKGFVTTLLSGHRYWEANERQNFLENIDDNVDQVARLLENAQELFKLEVEGIGLDRRPTDIKRLLQRVVQSLTFQKQGHSFQLDLPETLPSAAIDSLRVEQVLHNLLDNAVKYSPRDKKIQIKAQQQDDHILISVTDEGVGIPAEHLDHIFDGFYQVTYGHSDLARGTGIGLYVARGLVLAHGGRIWAENAAGQGTAHQGTAHQGATIHFTLPIEAKPSGRETPAVKPPAASKPISQPKINGSARLEARPNRDVAKILVVDDDPQMLRLLKIKLEVEGFEAITATRGSIALELAVAEQPDVILLDVSLPDMNGFDICSRMREFTNVPIIMITAQSKEEDMVRGLDSGADDYILKPIRNKELLARVRANLRRARVPEQAPGKPIFRSGELMIDFAQRQVTVRGQVVRLTPTEYKLLYHLAANAGRILTHNQLLAKVWGPGYEDDTQYLWVNISRLRGKLEDNPSAPQHILTEPGVGYYLPDQNK